MDLDRRDLRRYVAAVAPVVRAIERMLAPDVFANRVGAGCALLPHGPARIACGSRPRVDRSTASAVIADVRRCFASIDQEAVRRSLVVAGIGTAERRRIGSFLDALRRAGLVGLPVGPEPSAIVANAVLALADQAAIAEGGRVLRWVDDVVIVGPGEPVAVRAFDAWVGALRELGLEPHEGKIRRVRRVGEEPRWGRGVPSGAAPGRVP